MIAGVPVSVLVMIGGEPVGSPTKTNDVIGRRGSLLERIDAAAGFGGKCEVPVSGSAGLFGTLLLVNSFTVGVSGAEWMSQSSSRGIGKSCWVSAYGFTRVVFGVNGCWGGGS